MASPYYPRQVQVFDAQKAAVRDVERLLQHPEDLRELPVLLEEWTRKYQANKNLLSTSVASQVDAARTGIQALDNAQRHLKTMQDCYRVIDELCTECSSLVENHDKIRVLSAVHYNLGKTLQDVSNISELPTEAEEAEKLLLDDEQLLLAYETLSVLEGTSNMAETALKNGTKLKPEDVRNLAFYFNKVRDALGKFEERLWSIVRRFLTLARADPARLVAAVRIVELQQLVDAQLADSAAGALKPKMYKKRCLDQITNSIKNRFAYLEQKCSQLAVAEDTDNRIAIILDEAESFVAQLADVYDFVEPCFPPSYKIFTFIFKQYHQQLDSMLLYIGCCAEQLANADILRVIQWVSGYQESLGNLGVPEEDTAFPQGQQSGLQLLMQKYIQRMQATRKTWFTNILETDLNSEPKEQDNGRLWTPGAVDFFRIVNEQVDAVAGVTRGDFLLHTAQAVLEAMLDFQEAQRKKLTGPEPLPDNTLCALINNNMRSHDASTDFAEQLEESLADSLKGKLDIDAACRGFLDLAKLAMAALVQSMFAFPAFQGLFHKLYCSPDWTAGDVSASILKTLESYFEDYETMLEPSFYKRLAEASLEETVAHFTAALLVYCKSVTEQSVALMEQECRDISAFFSRYCKPDKVVQAIQPLDRLRRMADEDSVEDYVMCYTSVLQVAPGITPSLLERLINGRSNMNKADRTEVMAQCKEAHKDRHQLLGEEKTLILTPTKGGKASGSAAAAAAPSKDKDSVFAAALMAVKRGHASALA